MTFSHPSQSFSSMGTRSAAALWWESSLPTVGTGVGCGGGQRRLTVRVRCGWDSAGPSGEGHPSPNHLSDLQFRYFGSLRNLVMPPFAFMQS